MGGGGIPFQRKKIVFHVLMVSSEETKSINVNFLSMRVNLSIVLYIQSTRIHILVYLAFTLL